MQTISLTIAIITLLISFLAQFKKNKKIIEITAIGLILQFGSYFDVWSFVFRNNFNESSTLLFLYSLVFPLFVSSSEILCRLKKEKILILLYLAIPVFCICVDYKIVYTFIFSYVFLIILILYFIAIIVCFWNCFKFKFKLTENNYLYFSLLGFIVLDLFYYLGFYHVIDFKMSVWMTFLNFYLIYLSLLRVVYIIYVSKNF
jgi:hypothetical protein